MLVELGDSGPRRRNVGKKGVVNGSIEELLTKRYKNQLSRLEVRARGGPRRAKLQFSDVTALSLVERVRNLTPRSERAERWATCALNFSGGKRHALINVCSFENKITQY